MTTPPSDSQLDVLLVATWFPALDDPIAGRFVADQAEALLETGRVRPAVVSFEPAALIGAGRLRSRLAETVRREAAGAVRNHPEVFAPRGHDSAAGIPLARPSIPGGRDPAAGPLHAALGREAVLGALADRWLGAVVPGPAPGDLPGPLSVPLPALIHGHTVYPDGAAAATLARRLGRPLFLTEHASFVGRLIAEPAIRRRYLETVAAAERLLVVSHTLAGELATALPEIASRITVVPNAVDLRSFPLAPASERRPAELLYVGYRKASKGTETLLTAFAQLHARRPEVTLRLVGRSPDAVIERGWHRLAGELGVAEAVRFEGPADRAGVAAALARATLFVHPSSRETFGIVAVEALATGLPVVAADSGGVTEILGDDPAQLGALVPSGDPEALAEAILATLARRSTFDPAALRASVAGRFDRPAVAARILELYDEAVAGGPGRVATASVAAAPRPRSRPEPVRVVVAFDPDRGALLSALPAGVRTRLVLVTSEDFPGDASASLAGIVRADLQGRLRTTADAAVLGTGGGRLGRLRRALRHPLAVARRRGLLPGLERLITTRGTAAVRAGLARGAAVAGAQGPLELVCLDGPDHLAAEACLDAGEAQLAPGGLRWLGDRGDPG